jgi:hypothetical protein
MTRNSRRPVRRLTESQLRNIIRQEVRRSRLAEMAAPGAKMAMLPVSLAEVEEYGLWTVDLQDLAASMGLESKMGRDTFTVTGPRPAVEKFALELESDVMGGAQSISDEGLFAKIRNI